MKPKRTQHMVSVKKDTLDRLKVARHELRAKSGRSDVTLGDTVERAINCLEDAHGGRAWLSPAEMGPLMAERFQNHLAAVVAQLIPQVTDAEVESIGFPDGRIAGRTVVTLTDGRTIGFVPPAPIMISVN